ncbi:GNAT superfamily N-acetyltransferase [Klebsiella sp. SORGH_AS 826]|nr:GNAT superfamily N-acetyltransferase [Klebsiella sp. SORGH_AS_0826]
MSAMFSNWSRRSARAPSAGLAMRTAQLIAVARAISDCTWSSYLADVAIVPERQGQGYGQQLMLAIREQLLPFGKIFIYAVADKITFYQRFGFAMLTTGMVCASEEGMQKMQEQGYIRRP